MIEFPARWALYGFDILAGGLFLLAFGYVLNGLRHGARMVLTYFASSIFIAGTIALSWFVWTLLSPTDWTGSFTIVLPSFSFIRFGL